MRRPIPHRRLFTVVLTALVLVGACSDANDGPSGASEATTTEPAFEEDRLAEQANRTVVLNARVYTLDPEQPWAEAFSYVDDRIEAVGSAAEVLGGIEGTYRTIDAKGNFVLPGFQDTHVHVPEAGINDGLCFFEPGLELADYEELAVECAVEQSESDWVRAAGPSLFDFRNTDELPIDVLDQAIPDRPALVLDDLGHAVWTNSLGLAAAGIGADDPNPQGGIFHRDAESGQLTGLLLEDAQQLVRNAAAPDEETVYEGLLVALDELARNGITTVGDAGGYWTQGHPAAWDRALASGELTVRGINSLYVYPDLDVDQQLADFDRMFSNDKLSPVQFDTAKIYIDGILDLGTALMIEPYDNPVDPNYPSGFSYFEPQQLQTYVDELHSLGYRMHFHVIGDAATRMALDSIAAIPDDPAAIAARHHRTTHTYLVDPADLTRFAELGVVADLQVGEASTDVGYHADLSAAIGDRAFDLLPVDSLLDAGASVSLSSDWDADPLSPLGIIERALTRETHAVADVETAIELVTLGAAYALGHDERTGSIEAGKQADFVILDQDLTEIDPEDIDRTRVLLTTMAGNETFRADF